MLRSAGVFIISLIILLAAFYFTERSFSPIFQSCVEKHQKADQNAAAEHNITSRWIGLIDRDIGCSGEFVDANSGAITALATIIIAAFTGTLWIATSRQAELTRQAFIADKRAFIFPTGVIGLFEANTTTGHLAIGARLAKQRRKRQPAICEFTTDCLFSNVPLPETFDFTQTDPAEPPGTGMLGPKVTSRGGIAPHTGSPAFTPQDIMDIQNRRRFLYLWGWARYFDTLPDTPEHVTRFCWQIFAKACAGQTFINGAAIAPTTSADCRGLAREPITFGPLWRLPITSELSATKFIGCVVQLRTLRRYLTLEIVLGPTP